MEPRGPELAKRMPSRPEISFEEITVPNDHRAHSNQMWERYGVLLLPRVLPDILIDEYVAERKALLGGTSQWRPGWSDPTPYMRVPSMLKLATFRPVTEAISTLIEEEPGLHLCLTGFQSTERAWHQDRYLNPEGVGERYIAAWMALDDIHPDSGPFEYVPGSHLWPVIERKRVWDAHARTGGTFHHERWPWDTQGWVGAACQDEIDHRRVSPVKFIPRRGDVLLWHASLVHRGSMPIDTTLERPALIAHYSGVKARPDMQPPIRQGNGSHYFPF